MAAPLNSVPDWVPNVIYPKILFITENYPKDPNASHDNTYFYRTLRPGGAVGGPNNLLNNLCRTLGIIGASEHEKLNTFMFDRNYFLIDTFPSGCRMNEALIQSTLINFHWVDAIIDDIAYINPNQIVFTCVGSNGRLLSVLTCRAIARRLSVFGGIVHPPFPPGRQVFHSPSNRAHTTFNLQILGAIGAGTLIL
jgi:hypothetical protein